MQSLELFHLGFCYIPLTCKLVNLFPLCLNSLAPNWLVTFTSPLIYVFIILYIILSQSYILIFPLRATVLATHLHTNYVIICLSKKSRSLSLLSLSENIPNI